MSERFLRFERIISSLSDKVDVFVNSQRADGGSRSNDLQAEVGNATQRMSRMELLLFRMPFDQFYELDKAIELLPKTAAESSGKATHSEQPEA